MREKITGVWKVLGFRGKGGRMTGGLVCLPFLPFCLRCFRNFIQEGKQLGFANLGIVIIDVIRCGSLVLIGCRLADHEWCGSRAGHRN